MQACRLKGSRTGPLNGDWDRRSDRRARLRQKDLKRGVLYVQPAVAEIAQLIFPRSAGCAAGTDDARTEHQHVIAATHLDVEGLQAGIGNRDDIVALAYVQIGFGIGDNLVLLQLIIAAAHLNLQFLSTTGNHGDVVAAASNHAHFRSVFGSGDIQHVVTGA